MKIGVIGLGVVGKAVHNVFKEKGVEVLGYDISSTATTFEEMLSCELLFLCLPSPTVKGKQDLSAIENTLAKLETAKYSGIVTIKSTMLPGTTEKFQQTVSFDLVHNPEFLSAKTAEDDFRHQKTVLIGSSRKKSLDKVRDFYCNLFHMDISEVVECRSQESEMAKYMSNVFFAVKVGVFNEFYKVCQEQGISYDASVQAAIVATEWLHPMHTKVPGTDGQLGWGGMCFPKDVIAFLNLMQGDSIIKTAMDQNVKLRDEMLKYL